MNLSLILPALLLILTAHLPAPAAKADQAGKNSPITVFAAASLTHTLPHVADAWKKNGGTPVVFSFDATSRLAKQISEGAPADVFFSADEEWMDFLAQKNLIHGGTRQRILTNELVVVAPAGRATSFSFDNLKQIALAGENVPAGKYAAAALTSAGRWEKIRPLVVRGDNVRTVLSWVSTGDVQAGIVYKTDAMSVPGKVKIVHTFPPGSHPVISYPAAVVAKGSRKNQAAAFLDFCRSKAGAKIFQDAGFTAPGT